MTISRREIQWILIGVGLSLAACQLDRTRVYVSNRNAVGANVCFTEEEKASLPAEIRDRKWTEYRSSRYDGKGGTRLFIVLPASRQAEPQSVQPRFEDLARWQDLTESDGGVLVMPNPGLDSTWDASDLPYLEATYAHCSRYAIEGSSRYLAAYGDASIPAALFAMKNTWKIAGLAIIDAHVLAGMNPTITKTHLPLAVLVIRSSGRWVWDVIEHFKTANGADQVERRSKGETIHYQRGSSLWNTEYPRSHFVRIVDHSNGEIPSLIYNQLFRAVGRWRTIKEEGTLRARVRAGDIPGFKKVTEPGDPVRTAFVYLPSAIRNRTRISPVPIVVLFHGWSSNGEYFIDQTQWYRAAEKGQFIVYAPNGLGHGWHVVPEEHKHFARKIDQLAKEGLVVEGKTYPIDPSRIYVYGFSNGSFFASEMIMKYPERFAAAALWAGGYNPASVSDKSEKAIPVWYGIGTEDSYYNEWKADVDAMISHFVRLAGGNLHEKDTVFHGALGDDHLITTEIYKGPEIEIRHSEAKRVEHGNLNEFPDYIWTEFFAKYRKQDGHSISCSVTVRANTTGGQERK